MELEKFYLIKLNYFLVVNNLIMNIIYLMVYFLLNLYSLDNFYFNYITIINY